MARFVPTLAILMVVALCASTNKSPSDLTVDSNMPGLQVDTGAADAQWKLTCPPAERIAADVAKNFSSAGLIAASASDLTVLGCKNVKNAAGQETLEADIKAVDFECTVTMTEKDVDAINSNDLKSFTYEFLTSLKNCTFKKILNDMSPKKPEVKPLIFPHPDTFGPKTEPVVPTTPKARKCKAAGKMFDFVVKAYKDNFSSYSNSKSTIKFSEIQPNSEGCEPKSEVALGGLFKYDLKGEKCSIIVQSINDDVESPKISENSQKNIVANLRACIDKLVVNYAERRRVINAKKADKVKEAKAAKAEEKKESAPVVTEQAAEDEVIIADETPVNSNDNSVEEIKEEIKEEVFEEIPEEIEGEIEEVNVPVVEEPVKKAAKPVKVKKGNCKLQDELFTYITDAYEKKHKYTYPVGGPNMSTVSININDCKASEDERKKGGLYTFTLNNLTTCNIVVETFGTELTQFNAERVTGELNNCVKRFKQEFANKKRDNRSADRLKRKEASQLKAAYDKFEPLFDDVDLDVKTEVKSEPVSAGNDDGFITVTGKSGFAAQQDADFDKPAETVDIDEEKPVSTPSKKALRDRARRQAKADAKKFAGGAIKCDGEAQKSLIYNMSQLTHVEVPKEYKVEECTMANFGAPDSLFTFTFAHNNRRCEVLMRIQKSDRNELEFHTDKDKKLFEKQIDACKKLFAKECAHDKEFSELFKSEYAKQRRYQKKSVDGHNARVVSCAEDAANNKNATLKVMIDDHKCDVRVYGIATKDNRLVAEDAATLFNDVKKCLDQIDNYYAEKDIRRANAAFKYDDETRATFKKFSNSDRQNSIVVSEKPAKLLTQKTPKALIGGPRVKNTDAIKAVAANLYAKLAVLKIVKSQFVSTQNIEKVESQLVAGTIYSIFFSFDDVKCQMQVFEGLPNKDGVHETKVYHDKASEMNNALFLPTLGHKQFTAGNCVDVFKYVAHEQQA